MDCHPPRRGRVSETEVRRITTPALFVLDQASKNAKLHFGSDDGLTLCGRSLTGAVEHAIHLLREEDAERGICPECAILYFSREDQ